MEPTGPENNNEKSRWLHFVLIVVAFGLLIACFVSNAFVKTCLRHMFIIYSNKNVGTSLIMLLFFSASAYARMDVQPEDFCFYIIWAVLYVFQVCDWGNVLRLVFVYTFLLLLLFKDRFSRIWSCLFVSERRGKSIAIQKDQSHSLQLLHTSHRFVHGRYCLELVDWQPNCN